MVSDDNYTYYSFLATYTMPTKETEGQAPDWAPNHESRELVTNNDIIEVPAGCNFLVINSPNAEDGGSILQHVYVNGIDVYAGTLNSAIWNYAHNLSKQVSINSLVDYNHWLDFVVNYTLVRRPYQIQTDTWYGTDYFHIIIPVVPGVTLEYVNASLLSGGTTYYFLLQEYTKPVEGQSPSFASGYSGRQLDTTGKIKIPNDCHFIGFNVNAEGSENDIYMPTSLKINRVEFIRGSFSAIGSLSKIAVKESDLKVTNSSINLANPRNVVNQMIDNLGDLHDTDGSWKGLVIPLTSADAGKKITVGGFYMGRDGYANFFNGDTKVYEGPLWVTDAQGTQNPNTFTVPENCTKLVVDILSPLASDPEHAYDNLMANWGETLLPYTPAFYITKIKGIDISGQADVTELQAEVDELQADIQELQDNFSNVVFDLPVSDGTDVQVGYAYINSTDGVVKVKMS